MTDRQAPKRPAGLVAIEAEMARQSPDAQASFERSHDVAAQAAASIRRTGRLLMLGMGASHAVGRAVEPFYREQGIDAIALPLSEQLVAPLPTGGRTILVTSQSGESAEVLRWLAQDGATSDSFGLTLLADSTLGRTLPCLIGHGGPELAFAATRSLTIALAQHLAILAALGVDPAPALAALQRSENPDISPALAWLANSNALVVSGRLLKGLAEAIALGLCELARRPAFALEGGQLRHGPMEMLGPEVGVLQFRSDEPAAALIGSLSAAAAEAGSPVVILDCSGARSAPGTISIELPKASGMAALFVLLPVAQRLMVSFAAARVPDVGTPCRSTKITRTE